MKEADICAVFRKLSLRGERFFGLTCESAARNADLKRWKNLPRAAPIADRWLCSRTTKAIILPKHDGNRFSEKIMLKQQASAIAFRLETRWAAPFCHGTAFADPD
jgi:hypothetical protein